MDEWLLLNAALLNAWVELWSFTNFLIPPRPLMDCLEPSICGACRDVPGGNGIRLFITHLSLKGKEISFCNEIWLCGYVPVLVLLPQISHVPLSQQLNAENSTTTPWKLAGPWDGRSLESLERESQPTITDFHFWYYTGKKWVTAVLRK